MRGKVVAFVAATTLGLSVPAGIAAPAAGAVPGVGCVHRGVGHVAGHGGQYADDAWHRSRGERTTCAEKRPVSSRDETSRDGQDRRHHGKRCPKWRKPIECRLPG